MTDIEVFRSFRAGVAPPSPRTRADAFRSLTAAIDGANRRSVRPRFQRVGLAVAAGVGAVSVAFVVAGLLDDSPGVIERAAAAMDPSGRVLHVVARVEGSDGSVSIGESWVRPDGSGRSLVHSGGGPRDCLASPEELRCYDADRNVVDVYRYDPAAVEAGKRYADLPGFRVDQPESIQRALAEGYVRLLGEATFHGRAVREIQLAVPFLDANGEAVPRFDEASSPVLVLDAETYLPVAERFPDAGSTTTYETYEFMTDDARTRRLLELPTKPGVRVVVHPVGRGPQG
jgi:hypothetical protein